jgi:hypothetical protein
LLHVPNKVSFQIQSSLLGLSIPDAKGHLESSIMETLLSELFNTMFDTSYTPTTIQQSLETAARICETRTSWTNHGLISIPSKYKDVTIKVLSERVLKALESNDLRNNDELQRALTVAGSIVCLVTKPGKESWQGAPIVRPEFECHLTSLYRLVIEGALWMIAPRLIEVDLTLTFPQSLERWGWLRKLFSMSIGGRALDTYWFYDLIYAQGSKHCATEIACRNLSG